MALKLFSPAGPALKPMAKPRRPIGVYILWILLIAVIGVVAWIGITGAMALKNITAKNSNNNAGLLSGSLSPSQLQTEGDSRINILLAGIGGPGHSGPDLTDTLEIYSIDPINKTLALVSVPRDLYVPLPDTSHGRINAINTEGAQYCKKVGCAAGVDQGGAAMEDLIGKLIGIKINYFVRVNFQGFQQLVTALNGIDVVAPTQLYDPLYPCPDPSTAYCPINIKAGAHHFDGPTALEYARSRETSSDFARAARQQQIIAAIRDKASSLNILANPSKTTQLISILGKNLKTDIQPTEYTALLSLIRQLDNTKTITTVIDSSATGPLSSSVIGGADVLVPKIGPNDFSGVQAFVNAALKDPYVVKEAATVSLVNASGKPLETALITAQLKSLGYIVMSSTVATQTQLGTTVTNNTAKPFTTNLLQKHFSASFVPNPAGSLTDITITVGSRYIVK